MFAKKREKVEERMETDLVNSHFELTQKTYLLKKHTSGENWDNGACHCHRHERYLLPNFSLRRPDLTLYIFFEVAQQREKIYVHNKLKYLLSVSHLSLEMCREVKCGNSIQMSNCPRVAKKGENCDENNEDDFHLEIFFWSQVSLVCLEMGCLNSCLSAHDKTRIFAWCYHHHVFFSCLPLKMSFFRFPSTKEWDDDLREYQSEARVMMTMRVRQLPQVKKERIMYIDLRQLIYFFSFFCKVRNYYVVSWYVLVPLETEICPYPRWR